MRQRHRATGRLKETTITVSTTEAPTTPPAEEKKVTIDLASLQELGSKINEIDTSISAATGSEAAVRKSISAGFASENAEEIEKIVATLLPQFGKLEVPVLAGLLDRLPEAMLEEYEPKVKELIDAQVETATAGAKGDLTKLREERKAKVDAFKALKSILEQFQIDTSSVPDPKRGGGRPAGSGGGAAKTGRNKENYRYSMDGENRPPSQNTMSSLAYYSTMGCAGTAEKPERWSTQQLKDFLVEQGVTWGLEGDDTWQVELPNKRVIAARRLDPAVDTDILKDDEPADDATDETPAEAPAEA